jgi:hypothetical protein
VKVAQLFEEEGGTPEALVTKLVQQLLDKGELVYLNAKAFGVNQVRVSHVDYNRGPNRNHVTGTVDKITVHNDGATYFVVVNGGWARVMDEDADELLTLSKTPGDLGWGLTNAP